MQYYSNCFPHFEHFTNAYCSRCDLALLLLHLGPSTVTRFISSFLCSWVSLSEKEGPHTVQYTRNKSLLPSMLFTLLCRSWMCSSIPLVWTRKSRKTSTVSKRALILDRIYTKYFFLYRLVARNHLALPPYYPTTHPNKAG